MPVTGQAVRQTGQAVPQTGQAVPQTGQAVLQTGQAVRQTSQAMRQTSQAVRQTSQAMLRYPLVVLFLSFLCHFFFSLPRLISPEFPESPETLRGESHGNSGQFLCGMTPISQILSL